MGGLLVMRQLRFVLQAYMYDIASCVRALRYLPPLLLLSVSQSMSITSWRNYAINDAAALNICQYDCNELLIVS
jgi:hypothetical protein